MRARPDIVVGALAALGWQAGLGRLVVRVYGRRLLWLGMSIGGWLALVLQSLPLPKICNLLSLCKYFLLI